LFWSFIIFSLLPASALFLADIDNDKKDKNINAKHISGYIKTIFDSRKTYLEQKINYLEDKSNTFLCLGEAREGVCVMVEHASRLSENSGEAMIQRRFCERYQAQLKIFGKDPLLLYVIPFIRNK